MQSYINFQMEEEENASDVAGSATSKKDNPKEIETIKQIVLLDFLWISVQGKR